MSEIKLCKPPNLKHRVDVIVISVYGHCIDCDTILDSRESISIDEINQFILRGKELRSIKVERAYKKFAECVRCLE